MNVGGNINGRSNCTLGHSTFVLSLQVSRFINLMFTGLLSLVALAVSTATPLATLVIPQSVFNRHREPAALAIPFFILAGEIMNRGKLRKN